MSNVTDLKRGTKKKRYMAIAAICFVFSKYSMQQKAVCRFDEVFTDEGDCGDVPTGFCLSRPCTNPSTAIAFA